MAILACLGLSTPQSLLGISCSGFHGRGLEYETNQGTINAHGLGNTPNFSAGVVLAPAFCISANFADLRTLCAPSSTLSPLTL